MPKESRGLFNALCFTDYWFLDSENRAQVVLGTSALKELEITANTQFDDDFENFKHWSKIKLAFSKRLITKNSFNKYALNSTKSTKTDIEKNNS